MVFVMETTVDRLRDVSVSSTLRAATGGRHRGERDRQTERKIAATVAEVVVVVSVMAGGVGFVAAPLPPAALRRHRSGKDGCQDSTLTGEEGQGRGGLTGEHKS